jgi:hydroxymethylpyrimidine pyrophosphatase-like HAD family hydrolase
VTGRQLEELVGVFPQVEIFDAVVAENGALLYFPSTDEERPLAEPPPPSLVEILRERGVTPLQSGRVIVATREPYQTEALEAIRDLSLEIQVIFNKGAVMLLPTGINKATGLQAALDELGLLPEQAVGVGDAENDHAMLSLCSVGVAVANAVPSLKERAHWVTRLDHGEGVMELIDRMIDSDLGELPVRAQRQHVV